MQLEIETAQKELGIVEERVLERMMEADAVTAEIKKAEQTLTAQQKQVEAEKKTLAEELTTVEAALKDATESGRRSSSRCRRSWSRSSSRLHGHARGSRLRPPRAMVSAPPATSVFGRRRSRKSAGTIRLFSVPAATVSSTTFHHRPRLNRP